MLEVSLGLARGSEVLVGAALSRPGLQSHNEVAGGNAPARVQDSLTTAV
jgi:hypothetical protein